MTEGQRNNKYREDGGGEEGLLQMRKEKRGRREMQGGRKFHKRSILFTGEVSPPHVQLAVVLIIEFKPQEATRE